MALYGFGSKKKDEIKNYGLPKETLLEKFKRIEREYDYYVEMAEREFIKQGAHTKEECVLLDEAMKRCKQLATLSEGAEKNYRLGQMDELKKKLDKAVFAVSPETAKKLAELSKKEEEAKKQPEKSANSEKAGNSDKKGGTKKNEVSEEEVASWFKEAPNYGFDKVSGMADLKELLNRFKDDQHAKLRKYLDLAAMTSYLFVGPPGCGKTYIIEAFAHELITQKEYKYLSLVSGDILDPLVGMSEKKVKRLFEEINKNAPCIVFLDEIDAVCKNRKGKNVPEYAKTLTTAFLTGYNELKASDKNVIFIGATNFPNQVDDAMLDRVQLIRVPLPDAEARGFAFEMNLSKFAQLAEDITYEEMGAQTDKYNYRDIGRLVIEIKNAMIQLAESKNLSDVEMIEALQSGEIRITKELFEEKKAACLPTPKDQVLAELDEWENKFNKEKE